MSKLARRSWLWFHPGIERVLRGEQRWTVEHTDCLVALRAMEDASVDACVTDPPYELGFMSKSWDKSGIAFRSDVWREILRVLKPGAHLLAFGGTRTFHRITCAIEDAGFEIRDSIAWMHGQGFPKSLDISKQFDKTEGFWRGRAGAVHSGNGSLSGPNYDRNDKGGPITAAAAAAAGFGTALKPAFEPIIVARKPLAGTVADNFAAHGTGGLNIDACRVAHASADDLAAHEAQVAALKAKGGSLGNSWKNTSDLSGANDVNTAGRWPPNVLLSHDPMCERIGVTEVPAHPTWDTQNRQTEPSKFTGDKVSTVRHGEPSSDRRYADRGVTGMAPLPGARRDAVERVEQWRCVTAGSAVVPVYVLRRLASGPAFGRDTLDLVRTVLHDLRAQRTGDTCRERDVYGHGGTLNTLAEDPKTLDVVARVLGLTGVPGFLDGCRSCRDFGDEHARLIAEGGRSGAQQLADALARVFRRAESLAHIRHHPATSPQRNSDDSLLACEVDSTVQSKIGDTDHSSGSDVDDHRNARIDQSGPQLSARPRNILANSTYDFFGNHASACHSAHTFDCIQTLLLWGLEWARVYLSELTRGEYTIRWPSCPVAELARQSGESSSLPVKPYQRSSRDYYSGSWPDSLGGGYTDSGSAARFFPQFQTGPLDDITPFLYQSKPSTGERDAGLHHFRTLTGAQMTESEEGQTRLESPRSGAGRLGGRRNHHSTVKSIDLMRWITRLVTPPGGVVLDPFCGSGSGGIAALIEGSRWIGCEMNDDDDEPSATVARARISWVEGREMIPRESLRAKEPPAQRGLFETDR